MISFIRRSAFFCSVVVLLSLKRYGVNAWCSTAKTTRRVSLGLLSDEYLENDLVAVSLVDATPPRLCVVRPDGTILGLCQHEDDVETDLFVDPRLTLPEDIQDSNVVKLYGEGWYGQRPVPSLGGGPGYGAEADEVWSVEEAVLELVRTDGVDLPVLDVGIAHGEKARGGAL